jgi:hypothetical protein
MKEREKKGTVVPGDFRVLIAAKDVFGKNLCRNT